MCVYFVSRIDDDFCAHHHHAKSRETVVKVVADPSSSFSSFSAAGPRLVSLKFVRSLAFSLDVINYPL